MRKGANKKELLASEAETGTSFYGVLAGLTFTASIFIFPFHTSLPFGDIFLTFTLVATVFFIYSAALTASASGELSRGSEQEAIDFLKLSDKFGSIGFIIMFIDIAFIAFCTGWEYAVIVIAIIVLIYLYIRGS